MKTIGIVGGAGPMASSLLYKKIILECQQKLNCKKDADFPEIVIISYPFSPMLSSADSTANKAKIEQELLTVISKLENCGAQVVAIACNTLHAFIGPVNSNLINIIQETIDCAKTKNAKKLLVLGTQTTIENRLYEQNIEVIYPRQNDQEIISKIVDRILEGKILKADSDKINHIIKKTQDFDIAVLGCSELSVLHDQHPLNNIIDPLQVLASKCISELAKK